MDAFTFYITYTLCWLISLLPLRVLYLFSDLLYVIIYYLIGYRKKVVFINLQNSFPEKSREEIKKIAKGFYKHFADVLIEIIKLIHINQKTLSKHIKYLNFEILDKLYNQKKHVIAVTGHYGNWEWGIGIPKYTNYNVIILYQPISNKYFNDLILKLRTQFGIKLVHMNKAIRTILRYQQQKKLTLSFFIADQSPQKNNIQYWTTFLNQETPVYFGIEKIAKKTNQAVVFFKMQKVKRGYYTVEIIKLFDETKNTEQYEITEKHIRALENVINIQPEHWLWSHRRWKHKKA